MNRESQGQRVELIRCSDPWTRLRPGDKGTIVFEDDLGTVHINWDNGASLGLVPREDAWRILEGEDER